MSLFPIEKQLQPVILDKATALTINTGKLYELTMNRLGTPHVRITIQMGRTASDKLFLVVGPVIVLPREPKPLTDYFTGSIYSECQLVVQYAYDSGGFDPEEKLTRRDFIMQTLDIWERMLYRLDYSFLKNEEVIVAMEVLKGTYSLAELLPADCSMEQFKKYFEKEEAIDVPTPNSTADDKGTFSI